MEQRAAIDAVVAAARAFRSTQGRPKLGRLQWALNFAQGECGDVTLGQLQVQLTAFAAQAITGELFTESQVQEAHDAFRLILHEWTTRHRVRIELPPAAVAIGYSSVRTPRGEVVQRYHRIVFPPGSSMFTLHQVTEPLMQLLADEDLPLVKACGAPRRWGSQSETCGRWFAGRANQTYCTPLCQNRATTRASRARAKEFQVPRSAPAAFTREEETRALERLVAWLTGRLDRPHLGAQVDPDDAGATLPDARQIVIRLDRKKGRRGSTELIPYRVEIARPFLERRDALGLLEEEDRIGELLGVLRQGHAARINADGTITGIEAPAKSRRRGRGVVDQVLAETMG